MAKKHPRSYLLEFRQTILDLAAAGRDVDELARQFDVSSRTIRKWLKQAALDGGRLEVRMHTAVRSDRSRPRSRGG